MSDRPIMSMYMNPGGKSQEELAREEFETRKTMFQAFTVALGFEHMETENPDIIEAIASNGQTLFYCSPTALSKVSELANNIVKPIIIGDFTDAKLTKNDLNLLPKGVETYVLGEPATKLKNIPTNIHLIKNEDGEFWGRLVEELKPMTEL